MTSTGTRELPASLALSFHNYLNSLKIFLSMSCLSRCPVDCAHDEDASRLLTSPYPDLNSPYPDLLSSNIVPSDSQLSVIQDAIQRVEEEIAAILQLQRRRVELEAFVVNHQTALSTIRRLPNEILLEIFAYCRDGRSFHLSNNAPWRIARVCSRWRAVALGMPRLWSRFCVAELSRDKDGAGSRAISLQLERSGNAPLYVQLRGGLDRSVLEMDRTALDVVLRASMRWQNLELCLSASQLHILLPLRPRFAALEKLHIQTWGQPKTSLNPIPSFIKSLPALKELTLEPERGLLSDYTTTITWSRLNACTFKACRLRDTLNIFPLLSPGTRVTIMNPSKLIDDYHMLNPTTSPIRSLTLTSCDSSYIEKMFCGLIAPALEELDFGDDIDATGRRYSMADDIISFLDRSACPLTRLRIGYDGLCENDLLEIVKSESLSGLLTLEVSKDVKLSSSHGISMLSSPTFLPRLRALTLRCTPHFTEGELLRMVALRRPVLQSLCLETDTKRGDWTLSQTSLTKLIEGGLRVTLLSCRASPTRLDL